MVAAIHDQWLKGREIPWHGIHQQEIPKADILFLHLLRVDQARQTHEEPI